MSLPNKAIIVGAGPVGCYAAARLCQARLVSEVHVYEKQEKIGPETSAGRNVNVTLCKRGLDALKTINLIPGTEVLPAKQLTHFTIYTGGVKLRQPYFGDGLVSVKRNDLYHALHDKAISFGAKFHFGKQFDSILNQKGNHGNELAAMFVDKDGCCSTESCCFLIGSDGVHSTVRKNMFENVVISRYKDGSSLNDLAERYSDCCVVLEHKLAYKEISLAQEILDGLEMDTFHIWGSPGLIVLGLPSADETLTLGVYMDKTELRQSSTEQLVQKIAGTFPELKEILTKIEFKQEEPQNLGSLYCVLSPYFGDESMVLLGDAGHAMLPFLGQGLNSGLEDICLLMDCLTRQKDQKDFIPRGIQEFSKTRINDIHTIVHQSFNECKKLQLLQQDTEIARNTEDQSGQTKSFFELISTTNIGYKESLAMVTSKNKGIGARVKKGETLAIHQAVKTMAVVTSPCDGVVTDISTSASGQPVYTVKPDSARSQSDAVEEGAKKQIYLSSQLSSDQFDTESFKSQLQTKYIGQQFVYLDSTESTMDDAKSAAQQGCPSGSAFMAETMTKGRGRQGKSWTAPPKGNIYVTFVIRLPEKSSCLVQFAAALAVVKAIRSQGLDAKVKWPNDIWVRGHKVSGILVEAEMVAKRGDSNDNFNQSEDNIKEKTRGDLNENSDQSKAVSGSESAIFYLGIGINVNDDTRRNPELRNMATSISSELFSQKVPRERILAKLCSELELALDKDMTAILNELEPYLLLKRSSEVKVTAKEEEFAAVVDTIDDSGRLHVKKPVTEDKVVLSDLMTSVRPSATKYIYVYEGDGSSKQCVHMLYESLLAMCDLSKYVVEKITPEEIRQGDWVSSAAVLAIGGGFDTGYIRALGPEGLQIVRNYVHAGGKYLGICAGAYFACREIEFDKGGNLEVCGPRSLEFFPGKCIGPTFPGFVYNSEAGAQAAQIKWNTKASVTELETSQTGFMYYNGGGHFELDCESSENVEVISKLINAPDGKIRTTGVKCKVGKGLAILSGVHFEYMVEDLDGNDQYLKSIVPVLRETVSQRDKFYMSVIEMLGL